MVWPRRASLVAGVLALQSFASVALGQSDKQLDQARQLFREARGLVAERQYAEACPKFQKSLEIERGIGTMYNLADCWELEGKTASAFRMFVSTAKAARSLGQHDRSALARDRAAALVPKLSRLSITVGTPAEGISVWRNESQVDQALWGVASVIDPGVYEIKATAPGKKTWTAKVEIPDRATTISVTVPPLVDTSTGSKPVLVPVPASSKAKAVASEDHPRPLPPPEKPPYADSSSGNGRLVALSIGAAGVGALVAGVVLALDYNSKNNEASDICPKTFDCSRAEVERHGELTDDARSSRNWAYLAFGVGGAAVLGAGAIYIASPSPRTRSSSRTVGVSPIVGARGPVGASVRGSF